jgi:Protein of unknown function (DUF2778)
MWTYKSGTGELLDPSGNHVETGYAGGDKGAHKEGINNPVYQYTPDIGPLPVGWYTFGTPVEGTHLGPLAIPLTPDVDNDMRGRGDFYCHGDHIGAPGTASDGCMIFSHATRTLISQSPDHRLQVI